MIDDWDIWLTEASEREGVTLRPLEPEDIDSFASEGLYDAEMRIGGVLPVHRLRELPPVTGVLISP